MANWSKNAKEVLKQRYLLKDKDGKLTETPDKMLERVARYISLVEEKSYYWYDQFLSIMDPLEFLPNSPCLINAGKKNAQLSACFVLPVFDSIEHIFEMVKQSAIIHKTGGGTGFNFSGLRPSGAAVNSTGGIASGPVSFQNCFDVVTDTVRQGGVRRGANIGILNCTHPDIIDFIDCKKDGKSFRNFNISVALNGGFLRAANNNEKIQLNFRGFPFKEKIKASEILDKICENIWLNGEPGILFLDTINKFNQTPWLGRIWATNPCAEAPLLSYESCNLGSINLSKFVENNSINFPKLENTVKIAVRLLDDMIDVNTYPRVQIDRKSKLTRKIGLGVMGWADVLGMINIQYDSQEALNLAEKLVSFIYTIAFEESQKLGKEKGFCCESILHPLRRNTCVTSIAPTGTLSILADCSSSIEPYFSRSFTKEVINGTKLEFSIPWKVKTAMEISPEWHVRMQAVFQKYVDQGVSKTINLPDTAKIEEVKNAILLAYSLGCKGLTLYRQGTRDAPLQELSECESDKCLI